MNEQLEKLEPSNDAIVHSFDQPGPGDDRGADNFDMALDEFDQTNPKPPAPKEPQDLQQYLAQARALGFSDDEAMSIAPNEFKDRAELNKARDALEANYTRGLLHLRAVAEQVARERDHMDFDRLVRTFRDEFPDISQRVLETFLIGRHASDERTADNWRKRYVDPARWTREIGRLKAELHADAPKAIDVEATETKLVVSAAVRGGRPTPRDDALPRLNDMTDSDFSAWTKREFGYEGLR